MSFSVPSDWVKGKKFFPLRVTTTGIDLMTVAWQFLKNKSTVHGEIFEVRTYMLQCNSALLLRNPTFKTESKPVQIKEKCGRILGIRVNVFLHESSPRFQIQKYPTSKSAHRRPPDGL